MQNMLKVSCTNNFNILEKESLLIKYLKYFHKNGYTVKLISIIVMCVNEIHLK